MDNVLVSIIVASYNPSFVQLKNTVISAIKQKNISFEIIVADDGSSIDYFDHLIQIFAERKFTNYKFAKLKSNEGTCKNIFNGLKMASGKYIKTIAPGDYFFSDEVLHRWVEWMENEDKKVCFGNAVFYSVTSENKYEFLRVVENPQNIEVYRRNHCSSKSQLLNYVFLKDVPVGANFITDKELMIKYLSSIIPEVIYAEDMVYRMMLVDGYEFVHFNEPVVWYEYGTGISTNGSDKWKSIINREAIICNKLMARKTNSVRFRLAIFALSKGVLENVKYAVYPSLVVWKIKKTFRKRYSNTEYSIEEIERIIR